MCGIRRGWGWGAVWWIWGGNGGMSGARNRIVRWQAQHPGFTGQDWLDIVGRIVYEVRLAGVVIEVRPLPEGEGVVLCMPEVWRGVGGKLYWRRDGVL